MAAAGQQSQDPIETYHPQAQWFWVSISSSTEIDTVTGRLQGTPEKKVHRHLIRCVKAWMTAAAMAAPSVVAVPRPNSSRATRLALVALFRAAAVSMSSTRNVLCAEQASFIRCYFDICCAVGVPQCLCNDAVVPGTLVLALQRWARPLCLVYKKAFWTGTLSTTEIGIFPARSVQQHSIRQGCGHLWPDKGNATTAWF